MIAHAKKGAGAAPGRYVPMNAFAFGDWYCARTPTEERFAKALNERLSDAVKKRDRYVDEQRRNSTTQVADSFDRAVEETLRAQVKR